MNIVHLDPYFILLYTPWASFFSLFFLSFFSPFSPSILDFKVQIYLPLHLEQQLHEVDLERHKTINVHTMNRYAETRREALEVTCRWIEMVRAKLEERKGQKKLVKDALQGMGREQSATRRIQEMRLAIIRQDIVVVERMEKALLREIDAQEEILGLWSRFQDVVGKS